MEHDGGRLAVVGGAGTGKTTVLTERFAWLCADPPPSAACAPPESILVLARDADRVRAQIEARLTRGFEELHVVTVPGFCARLLHDEAIEAGLGPFVATASAADRLAMLLDRIDELSVRLHDFRGSPAAMLAGIVARIDRLKEQSITAQEYGDWASRLADGEPQTDREREFAQIYLAHDRMLAEQSLLDEGELVLRAQSLLEDKPHVRERTNARFRHVLVDDLEDLTPAQVKVLGLLGDEVTATMADPERATGTVIELERSLRCRERILVAAGAVAAPVLAGEPGGEVRFWRCANARGCCARAPRPARWPSWFARCATRTRPSPWRSRSARCRTASSGTRPSSSAQRCATCSPGCACSSTRPTQGRSCARWRARRSSCARSVFRAASQ